MEFIEEIKDEFIITCSICGGNFDEADVNIVDYELDLCIECEKRHLKTLEKSI